LDAIGIAGLAVAVLFLADGGRGAAVAGQVAPEQSLAVDIA
jgi:hypothetical protein